MMTSDDAKKLTFCPLSFSAPGGPLPCLGDDCQLWRREVVRVLKDDQTVIVESYDVMNQRVKLADTVAAYGKFGACGLTNTLGGLV